MMRLLRKFAVRPDVSRAGEHAISAYLQLDAGEATLLLMSRRQAADLAKALSDALRREVRT